MSSDGGHNPWSSDGDGARNPGPNSQANPDPVSRATILLRLCAKRAGRWSTKATVVLSQNAALTSMVEGTLYGMAHPTASAVLALAYVQAIHESPHFVGEKGLLVLL